MSGYNKHPSIHIENSDGKVFRGDEDILRCLQTELSGDQWTLIVETYPGVNEDRMHRMLETLHPDRILSARDILRDPEALKARLDCILTQDRVFGRMYSGELMDFADPEKVKGLRKQVAGSGGKTIVFGFGASLLADQGLCVYADLSRWEIQLRYRAGMSNYLTDNPGEDILRKFKQGYFLEWRIADKLKMAFMNKMQYFIDANRDDDLVMIHRELFEEALQKAVSGPFRVVPYFDPGVWGGQWIKKVCGLDPEMDNYAWSFDGVPEENSLCFDFDGRHLEMPAMNLILCHPKELLGSKVYARFGTEFPIRFDLLDTMGGQNLSLQVHPTTDYIHRNFGMAYTQDESYYILDADKDACVYLGLKEGVRVEEMIAELEAAQQDGKPFDAEKYINRIPAKKHDHFLIPAGTIHCSGKGAVVLEISATPYIFTFKLWDWGRLGLDGKPRPINIGRGAEVIAERRTDWIRKNLVNPVGRLAENEHYTEEHTGLHELEFIETRRFTIRDRAEIDCHESVNVLNLVEGTACLVESADGSFDPFEVHYAETFIVPECVGKYRLRAVGGPVKVMQAYVRT
ncbi:MAG: class I mannose-6-phosphate isomerase [Lachnospiraceae bacterium]|nr:class I mannose-6-phosphate isomerase [Lachnospiraceae bacterium]